jgi:hypothetical protein
MAFEKINAAALAANLPARWFPAAKRYGQSLRIGNLNGDRGTSLWICLRTGAWKDHASGEFGSDLISLYAARRNIGQVEALKELSGATPHAAIQRIPPISGRDSQADDAQKISFALDIWEQGHNLEGTPAASYLDSRKLTHGADMPLKYHPACLRGNERFPAMLGLMTDAITGEPCGIHRTFIKPDGSGKADFSPNKMMLGRARNAVIRLTPDDEVTNGLGIVEGIENGLAIIGIGWKPVWAALSAGGIEGLPVLGGIGALTIFADHDRAGQQAAQRCARAWTAAGKEVIVRTPSKPGSDWNDAVLEVLQ